MGGLVEVEKGESQGALTVWWVLVGFWGQAWEEISGP